MDCELIKYTSVIPVHTLDLIADEDAFLVPVGVNSFHEILLNRNSFLLQRNDSGLSLRESRGIKCQHRSVLENWTTFPQPDGKLPSAMMREERAAFWGTAARQGPLPPLQAPSSRGISK